MTDLITSVGGLITIITFVLFVVSMVKFKKKQKEQGIKFLKFTGISFLLMIVLSFVSILFEEQTGTTDQEKAETVAKTGEEKTKETQEDKASREAKEVEEKAKEEERKVKEVEQKAEEAKLKEEQAAKAEVEKEVQEKENNTVEQKQPVAPTKVQTDEDANNSRKIEIEKTAKNIVKSDFLNADIKSIEVNNYQLEDNKFIVLAKLKWNTPNSKKTTKQMLEMYSDNLAAKLHDNTTIVEVVVFWEVPYHLENANVAKYTYTRASSGMAKTDNWIDPILN